VYYTNSDPPTLYVRKDENSKKWYPAVYDETDKKIKGELHKELHNDAEAYKNKVEKKTYSYKTGGLADFTGPAWLDGTPSRPEYILNADQTERFFSLIDVLEKYNAKDDLHNLSGNNYFEIEINVEKLESDYDVEKVAEKIRSMIYNDATYRNVNAINYIR
jgi:hypothetical protein